MTDVRIKRVYDEAAAGDGTRVLVDRVWPRGIKKTDAALDEWRKDAAPTTELRKWYGHDEAKYEEFSRRYRAELTNGDQAEAFDHLRTLATDGTLTLLTATKQPEISQAAVLRDLLS